MITLFEDQENILSAMLSGKNIFLTGDAGTGKSTVVKAFAQQAENCIFLAPTGLAAININGSTLHRFFDFNTRVIDPRQEKNRAPKPSFIKIVKAIKTIVIDEVSMMRADIMEALNIRLQLARGNDLPFGGIQMIIVGDLFQLSPVALPKDKKILSYCGFKNYYFFNTQAWRKGSFTLQNLLTVRRKEGNNSQPFLDALNAIRIGDRSAATLKFFNDRYQAKLSGNPVILCTTNKKADETNQMALRKLAGRTFTNAATITNAKGGSVKPCDYPTLDSLSLKVGARVMSISNNEDAGYMNGNLGTILSIGNDEITVAFDNITTPIAVKQKTWKIHKYQYSALKKTVIAKEIGEFKQYPIKLAWAVTIHKAQGQTLDSVILDLGRGTFDHGQLYVALSRVRSIQHLSLETLIRPRDVIVNRDICDFMDNLKNNTPLQGLFINGSESIVVKSAQEMVNLKVPKQFEKQVRDYLKLLNDSASSSFTQPLAAPLDAVNAVKRRPRRELA